MKRCLSSPEAVAVLDSHCIGHTPGVRLEACFVRGDVVPRNRSSTAAGDILPTTSYPCRREAGHPIPRPLDERAVRPVRPPLLRKRRRPEPIGSCRSAQGGCGCLDTARRQAPRTSLTPSDLLSLSVIFFGSAPAEHSFVPAARRHRHRAQQLSRTRTSRAREGLSLTAASTVPGCSARDASGPHHYLPTDDLSRDHAATSGFRLAFSGTTPCSR